MLHRQATPAQPRPTPRPTVAATPPAPRRWLLFVHHLPASPSNLRVRTWRRLQQLGAVPVKQAVYALPDSPTAREDFEWLKAEVKGAGGAASVFAAASVDTWSDDALVEEFRRSSQDAYEALAGEIEQVLNRLSAARRPQGTRRPAVGRLVGGFRERLAALEQIDFFGSAGRDRVAILLSRLDERTPGGTRTPSPDVAAGPMDRSAHTGRLWVTRPRPGVDRMSSAWLIRRFVDPEARFGFAADREHLPAEALPFDMFGVAFSHHGDACTFETLCRTFNIEDAAVARIAAIVHDLDLKDGRFGAPEAGTVGALLDGLQLSTPEDDVLLERGITVFEALYLSFARAARPPRPRGVSTSHRRASQDLPAGRAKRRRAR